MTQFRVKEIWRYPVKSMQGERLGQCQLTAGGIPLDRGWALYDEESQRIRGAKWIGELMICAARFIDGTSAGTVPHVEIALPSGARVRSDDPAVHDVLSDALGRKVTLLPLPQDGNYFDACPVHVLTEASLRHLRKLAPDSQIDARRFRPNFVLEGEGDGLVENGWTGRDARLGHADISILRTTGRCIMTTRAQPGLAQDAEILKTLIRDTEQMFGVYAMVGCPGTVAVGDALVLAGAT
ncbi:MAG TPA: MOSC domain-containing protein [Rhizomicrobium sp.]|nr:MOSC domain-containing protein [Rhizomicrobium sp.]